MRSETRVYVPLVGGLGNQLFGLSFCLWLRDTGYPATPFSNVRRSQTKFHAQHFDLLHLVRITRVELKAVSRANSWVLRKVSSLAALLQSTGLPVIWLETRHAAGDVAPPRPTSKIVRGYFQDANVAANSIPEIRAVLSTLFNSEFFEAGFWSRLAHRRITVHYRRGDYLNHSETFGLLSDEYFIRACEIAREESGINSVRVISDGCSRALEARLSEKGFECEFLATHDLSPIELLFAFARLRGYLVISNSSFSWWGAALNEKAKVMCPEPWFRSEELVDMSLPTWRKLEAVWTGSTRGEK